MGMKGQKSATAQPPAAKQPVDWLKQKQLRQKQAPLFNKVNISKVGFHGTQHRG